MSSISLHPYQQEAIRAVQSEWRTGHYRTLIIMPEGAGSELCIIALAYAAASRGERFLILVHNVLCVPRYMDLISELPVNLAALAGADAAGRSSDSIALEDAAEALPSTDLLDPREFMRLMSGITLYEYEPRQRREFLSATSNQKSLLRMYGFNTHALSRGLAKQLIETVITRDNRRMATPLQMHELADYGFSDVAQWSSGGAAWMLGEIESNGGRIPSNIDPATYKPC